MSRPFSQRPRQKRVGRHVTDSLGRFETTLRHGARTHSEVRRIAIDPTLAAHYAAISQNRDARARKGL